MMRANRKYIFFLLRFPSNGNKILREWLVCTGFDKEKVNPAHYKQATHARFLLSERITVI